ncbi:MAG TPA: tetratricopeptide repeat protein [Nodosilinea sp.]|nr:tetratricopeptide repeat protein [Nodosilinea sp.]
MHIYRQQQRQQQLCPLPAPAPLAPHEDEAQISSSWAGLATYPTADETLRRLAAAAVRRQQYHQAVQLLGQLIERHPQRAIYYSNRGLVYLRMGRLQAALSDCHRAVDLGPNLDHAYNNRAMCYAALGQLTAAVEDYERAIDLNPFNSRARINLGTTLRQMGDLDSALDCFDEALMFYQLSEVIYAERGRTYHLRGDWNCAIADYQRALAAAAHLKPSRQLQALVQQVQTWISDLLPQQSWA